MAKKKRRKKATSSTETPASSPPPSFASLGLGKRTLAALDEAGYELPTPVQAGVIPEALQGKDVLGQARTGTGKTASFVLPILERLASPKETRLPQALILVPTRELAVQVQGEVNKLAQGRKIRCVAAYGGKPIRGQIERLQRGAQVIVGTPGRVIDHINRGTLNLSELAWVVLDEADRMLDIGFRPDIEKILRRCPRDRQTLLLSATVPPIIERLSQRYMQDPVQLNFSTSDLAVETIEQFYFTVDRSQKFDLLLKLLTREDPRQTIIFCRTKRGTERVYQRLSKKLKDVGAMHGDMAQSARTRMMDGFRGGRVRFLVATDVIGRGIDVSSVSHIVNFDIPEFSDDYVHRVGRTGRMGREGVAFTFVTPEEGPQLTRIEMRIDRLLQRDQMDGMSPAPTPTPEKETAAPEKETAAPPETTNEPPPPKPLFGRGGRPIRRHRRAL